MEITSELNYDFLVPQRIVFGWGRRREVGALARTLGRRAFLVSGLPEAMAGPVVDEIVTALRTESVEVLPVATLMHEPEVDDVDQVAAEVRGHGARPGDLMLAVGGGATIDLAKAVAAMAVNNESPTVKDYLENVGRDLRIIHDPLPVLAMPTTAATGAEATKNAVISSYDPPFKKSLRDERLVPRIALVDPELTVSVPPAVTAAGGMDAITQLIESYISRKAQPIPQALAVQGLRLAVPSIVEAVENGSARGPRERMSHAALLSGMALANSGLGMAHGVAPALGTHCRVSHGAACALMLPVALRVNSMVRQAELAQLAHALFGSRHTTEPEQAVEMLIAKIEEICDRVGVPRRLSQVGVRAEQIPALVKSSRGSSMSGNPVELSDDELTTILEELL
ncbi:MAG TPA: iron-containing alcohol dehydrogenase [Thermoguttaceae bacterium]|nr:iron-containing alcohol dehydrogenase [Thermoguttaceae bacterium]